MLIFRRWKIALPLLLLSIGATVFVAVTAKPDYKMTSYVQFIPPKLAAKDDPAAASLRNPWNQLGLNTLGQAAIYATQDQGFLDQLKATHHTGNFTLTLAYPNPTIMVEVVGTTPTDARDTTDLILGRLKASSEALQRGSGVGDADLITALRLDRGQNVVPSNSKVKRAIIAVAAAGLVVTAGGAVGIDAILRRRARKRSESEESPAEEIGPEAAGVNGSGRTAAELPAVASAAELRGARGFGGSSDPPAVGGGRPGPSESIERTAIIIKRSSSVVKPVPKQERRVPAATYRSTNAQHLNGDNDTDGSGEPVGGSGPSGAAAEAADASDVRVARQPEWVGGENGNKAD